MPSQHTIHPVLPAVMDEEELQNMSMMELDSIDPIPPMKSQVKVVMIKNVKVGRWLPSKEWRNAADEKLRPSSGEAPLFHTPRLNCRRIATATSTNECGTILPLWLTLRSEVRPPPRTADSNRCRLRGLIGTLGTASRFPYQSPRGTRQSPGFELISLRRLGEFPRSHSTRQSKERCGNQERPSAFAKRAQEEINAFEDRLPIFQDAQEVGLAPQEQVCSLASTPTGKDRSRFSDASVVIRRALNDKPGRAQAASALASLVCSMPRSSIITKYYSFCRRHLPDTFTSLKLTTNETEDKFSVSQAPSPLEEQLLRQIEKGEIFQVHPDGMTFRQFCHYLDLLLADCDIDASDSIARHVFMSVGRENQERLRISDLLETCISALFAPRVRGNVDFFISCFDPYHVGKVPVLIFNSKFLAKYITQYIPDSVEPQWNLLVEAIRGLEAPALGTSRHPCQQRSSNDLWKWLHETYLHAHRSYRLFVDRSTALAHRIRGPASRDTMRQRLMHSILARNEGRRNTVDDSSMALGISHNDARAVIYGTAEILDLFTQNNFTFITSGANDDALETPTPSPALLPFRRIFI